MKVRPAEELTRAEPLGLSQSQQEAFNQSAQKYQSGLNIDIPEVFLACVHEARVFRKDFIIQSKDGKILMESALSRPDYLEASGILDTVMPSRHSCLSGQYCLLANRSIRGYYHWLFDILPRLSIVEQFEELRSVPLILPGPVEGFHRESLRLLGIKPENLFIIGPGCWKVDTLFFPEMLAPTGSISPHAVEWLRRRFLGSSVPVSAPARGRRIYLTRRDATQRRVLNEPEIIEFLTGIGFSVVCPGDLSFCEQIELFREVSILVAPHGAGQSNMVFAGEGATVIEFFGDNYINGCFWALSNICKQKHAFLIGPATWLDYSIPLSDLKAMLGKLNLWEPTDPGCVVTSGETTDPLR